MAEFKEASLWHKLAFLMTCMGFILMLFAFATGLGGWGKGRYKLLSLIVSNYTIAILAGKVVNIKNGQVVFYTELIFEVD